MACHEVGVDRLATILLATAVLFSGTKTTSVSASSSYDSATPEVTTAQGTLRGIVTTTRHGRNVSTFLGVPYAEPPIGDLRFRNTVPKTAWDGVRDASTDGSYCPQFGTTRIIGAEDCLYLNVFTPQLPETENSTLLLPVMFFVPGGGFEYGATTSVSMNGNHLLDEDDVVLVSLNYRIGILGFLSTGDEVSPGNYGLKDQIMALKWIQENIVYFGGDPDQVTLFGQSAGAAVVHLLALSEAATGLFDKYITESGTALAYWSYRPRNVYKDQAYKLGRILNCTTDSSTDLIACLRTRNVSDILNTRSYFFEWGIHPIVAWGPTDEVDQEGSILTSSPIEIIREGQLNDVPWINGFNGNEGFQFTLDDVYTNLDAFEDFLGNISYALPYILHYKDQVADEVGFTNAIQEYYFGDLSAERDVLFENYTNMISDGWFAYPAYRAVREQLAVSIQPIYLYVFEYRGTFSYSEYFTGTTENLGVWHNDELLYLFQRIELLDAASTRNISESDYQMLDTMVELWTSFAIHGQPVTTPAISNTTWCPYTEDDNYLQIGNDADPSLRVAYSVFENRMSFWDHLVNQS